MSYIFLLLFFFTVCFLQISTSKRTKKPSDVTLKSAANDLFLIAENCSPPDHVCPVACSAAEEVDIICVTNGQILMKIQNRCEYERIRSCCPIYKSGKCLGFWARYSFSFFFKPFFLHFNSFAPFLFISWPFFYGYLFYFLQFVSPLPSIFNLSIFFPFYLHFFALFR